MKWHGVWVAPWNNNLRLLILLKKSYVRYIDDTIFYKVLHIPSVWQGFSNNSTHMHAVFTMVKGSLPSMNSITHHSHLLPVGSCNEKTTLKISRLENYHPRNRKHLSGKRNHPGNTKHHLGKEKNTPPNYNIQLPNFTSFLKFLFF